MLDFKLNGYKRSRTKCPVCDEYMYYFGDGDKSHKFCWRCNYETNTEDEEFTLMMARETDRKTPDRTQCEMCGGPFPDCMNDCKLKDELEDIDDWGTDLKVDLKVDWRI